jgi:hypothetical protein
MAYMKSKDGIRLDAVPAALNPFDVGEDGILLIGQSNTVGYGMTFDAVVDVTDSRVRQFAGSGTYLNQTIAAVDGLYHREQMATRVGFGMTFGRLYAQSCPTNRRVTLIPAAMGGTGMFTSSVTPGTPAGYTYVAAGSWDPTRGAGGIDLLTQAVNSAKAFLALNPKNRITAILWLQGESDLIANTQAAYATRLDQLITAVRSEIPGATTTPFIVGQMMDVFIADPTYPQGKINAAHIDTPRRQQFTGFAYSPKAANDATMQNGDGIHFSAKAQRIIGASMFNAYQRALNNVTGTDPVTPEGLALSQSGTTMTATWAQPSGRVTDFNVRYSSNGGTSWTTLTRAQSIDVTASLTGLTLGSTYQVQVATVNEQGVSAWSASSTLLMVNLPAQVTGLTAGSATTASVPFTWSAATGAVNYLAQYKKTSDSTWVTATSTLTGTSYTFTGLLDSTSYDFRVIAANGAGQGTASATSTVSTLSMANLIDAVGVTAQRAYSTRKLRGAYAGSAIQVRRSSDNTTLDIGFVGNNLDTAALLTFAGSGDASVSIWYDQSGSGFNLTQATTTKQAKIVVAGVLQLVGPNRAGVKFASSLYQDTNVGLYAAGASSLLTVLTLNGTANFPVAVTESTSIASPSSANAYVPLYFDAGRSSNLIKDSAGTQFGSITGSVSVGTTTPAQVAVTDTGTVITQRANGATSPSVTYSRSGKTVTPTLFTWGDYSASGGGASSPLSANVGELVTFTAALDSTQLATARSNQQGYYTTA